MDQTLWRQYLGRFSTTFSDMSRQIGARSRVASAVALSLGLSLGLTLTLPGAAWSDTISTKTPTQGPTQDNTRITRTGTGTGTDQTPQVRRVLRGPVTNLPMPRYVSMKASKAHVRRGPSKSHRIDWVYTRRDLPLEIIAEHEHWRRVRDQEGVAGWIHHSLLSGVRTVLIQEDMLGLHVQPNTESPLHAMLEIGVVARLGECSAEWCRLSVGGFKGWAPKTALWGVAPDELRD